MEYHGGARPEADEDCSDDFVEAKNGSTNGDSKGNRDLQSGVQEPGEKYDVLFPAVSVKLNSSFSLNKVHSVFSSFLGEKRDLVKSIGFGGLMSMHNQPKISRRLAFWVLLNLDPVSGTVVLRPDLKVKISDSDVHLVLGLPCNEKDISPPKMSDSRAIDVVKAVLGVGKNSEISMDYVESLLTRDYVGRMSTKEKNAFKVAAVIFVDAHLLAPKSGPARVNHQILPYVADPTSIQDVNWSSYVLSVVKEASLKVKSSVLDGKKSVALECCLIFLKVFYLDNLAIGPTYPSHVCLPRVSDYPYLKMKSIISQDQQTSNDGKFIFFGRLKIRPIEQIVYSWGAGKVNCTPEKREDANEEVSNYVMNKIMDFKCDLRSCTTAYLDQVQKLVMELDTSVCEYYKNGGNYGNPPAIWSTYALTVTSMQGEFSDSELTPGTNVKSSDRLARTPIYVESCTANGKQLRERGKTVFAGDDSCGYSAGPAFDQSGRSASDLDTAFSSIARKLGSVSIFSALSDLKDDPPKGGADPDCIN